MSDWTNKYGAGSGQRPLGKNMNNEEYLQRQSEMNRMRRQQDQSRERQEAKKVQDREAGFNVYISGANEKRINEQRQREKYGMNFQGSGSNMGPQQQRQSSQNRSGSQSGRNQRTDSRGARRKWLAPQPGEDDESELLSDAKKQNYQNPFSIGESTSSMQQVSPFHSSGIPKPQQPSGRRKQWGVDSQQKQEVIGTGFLDSNTPDTIARKNEHAIQKPPVFTDSEGEEEVKKRPGVNNADDDDDDYSDSFEEVNATVETVNNSQIEDLLKTATEDQLNILKQSLGNWQDVKRLSESNQNSAQKASAQKGANNQLLDQQKANMNNNNTIEDDDYIEEDFEEDNSDSPIEDAIGNSDEEERLEQERLEQMRKEASRIQSTRNPNKPSRPISATYSLSNNLNTAKQGQGTGGYMTKGYSTGGSKQQDTKAVLSALEEENRRAIQSRRPAASATNYKGPGIISSLPPSQSYKAPLESIVENNKTGKVVQNNPFQTKGRPISQMLPKRPTAAQVKSLSMNQQNVPRVVDHQNYMQADHSQRESHKQTVAHPNNTIEEQEVDEDATFTRDMLHDSDMKASYMRPTPKPENQQLQQSPSIADLLTQITKLEDSQRHQLYIILKEVENGGQMSASVLQKGLEQFFTDKSQQPGSVQEYKEAPKERSHNELILRIMSTLGNPHVCGITEIELFDDNAQQIQLVPSCIMVKNQGKGPKVSVDKLINGNKLTKDDKQMWLGYLPTPPNRLEILLRFDKATSVGGIKIWNYNKGIIDCTKGVYELQILLNDAVKWSGTLTPGKGTVNVDYSKSIILKQNAEPGFALPREPIPEPQPQPQPQPNNQISSITSKPQASLSNAHSMIQLGQQQEQIEEDLTMEERLKKHRSKLDLAKGANGQSNIALGGASGPIWLDQEPKPKAREPRKSDFRDEYGQRDGGSMRARVDANLGEINSIVQGAVDSVNKAVEMSNSKRKEVKRPALVDESLDSLDYFKVTNLGRFNNNKEGASSTKQQSRLQQTNDRREQASSVTKKRPTWGAKKASIDTDKYSIDQQQPSVSKDSNSGSIRSKHEGPIVKSSALPEEFMLPSPARSIPSRRQTKNRDTLDDFMGVNVQNPVAPSSFARQHEAPKAEEVTQRVQLEDSFKLAQNSHEQLLGTSEVKVSSRIMDEESTDETVSAIPVLPEGKKLEINILETWGDMNYLGLTGIEVFDELGMPIQVHESSILAFPPDVNVLPGYGTDPRTVEKLIDGQYFTNDDLHVWLTPFTSGEDHQISINLGKFTNVSMIRIWNYNKSRIHSYRGAKLVSMELDGKPIFRGEIKKAPGNTKNPEDCCEIILFTEDDAILEMIDQNDWLNELDIAADEFDNTQRITEFQIQEGQLEDRPMTATKKFSTTEIEELQFQLQQQQSKPTSLFDERPMTSAIVQSQRIGMAPPRQQLASVQEEENYNSYRSSHQPGAGSVAMKKPSQGLRGQVIFINIKQSWGDLFYVGLNGLEILDDRGLPIPITVEKHQNHAETGQRSKTQVQAEPRDMNAIPGHGSDHRTLEKLFNGKNSTVDDRNMWLIPFNTGEDHTIRIDLGEIRAISALKFYNYNKSPEDTLRGARQVVIRLDDKLMTPKKGITLRIAPGTINGVDDIGQTIKIPYMQGWTNEEVIPVQRSLDSQAAKVHYFQECEPIAMPVGFLFKINLYSTHGDLFYIGLNGIELYDQNGYDVCVTRRDQCRVYAHPAGVHSLQDMGNDIRVVGNLIDGQNQTLSDEHIWLTPYKNTKGHASASSSEKDQAKKREPNYIMLMFEQPVALSALRIWNYSKTPSRGVNEFELEIDGQKIYRGFVRQAPDERQLTSKDWSSVVLFQGDASNADTLGRQINFNPQKVQNVLLMNERKQMNAQHQKAHVNEKFVFDEQLRPQTKALFK